VSAGCFGEDGRDTSRYADNSITIMAVPKEKPVDQRLLRFTSAAERAFAALPDEVRDQFLFALRRAELGKRHPDAKVLRGFRGASVLEVVVNHRGATYRAVYTLEFPGFVYLLHAFQKKSKTGTKTPKFEIDAMRRRIAAARNDYEERLPNK